MEERIRDTLMPDCFGNVAGKKNCCVLVEDVCLYQEKCPFYKTRKQFEADKKKYEERATSLSSLSGRKSGKMIRCVDTGRLSCSVQQASVGLGITESAIRQVLNGKRELACGFRFEYI